MATSQRVSNWNDTERIFSEISTVSYREFREFPQSWSRVINFRARLIIGFTDVISYHARLIIRFIDVIILG
jgi:hypothetical protein